MDKVDLDALDQLHAAATPGEWRGELHALHNREDIDNYGATYAQLTNGDHEIVGFFPVYDLEQCAALHNAYPAIAAEIRALRGRAYKLYKGLRDVVCAVGGVAEAGVSDEFLLNAAGEVRALREERDTLFADAAQWQAKAALLTSERDTLRAKAERLQEAQKENDQLRSLLSTSKADCAYCGLPANRMAECASGFPGCARADDMLCSATPTRDDLLDELTEARAEAARLREALIWQRDAMDTGYFLSKGYYYCQECTANALDQASVRHTEACPFGNIESALTSTPSTAEWLAARDAEQRRIGAAEELEKVRTGWLTSNEYRPGIPEIWRYIADRAARLRAGKGE
jgi:hypothetical protein